MILDTLYRIERTPSAAKKLCQEWANIVQDSTSNILFIFLLKTGTICNIRTLLCNIKEKHTLNQL